MAASPAFALKISPFKATLESGADGGQVFRIDNNSSEPAAVQVSATTWTIAPDGTEDNADAENDFAIFPAQVVLKPHESRAVRVQFLGTAAPGTEKPYRLVAEQLPVGLEGTPGEGSAVRFMLKFKAALYVTAGDVKSDIKVAKTEAQKDGALRVTLENRGTGHSLLKSPVLHVKYAGGGEKKIDGDALKPMAGENVHAGQARQFDIHVPDAAKVVSAQLDYEPAF